MTEQQQHARLTQEILIHSATWWMTDAEKTAFLTKTIIAVAVSATDARQQERLDAGS